MLIQNNQITAESYRDALTLADLAEAVFDGTANTAHPLFVEWAEAAGIEPHNLLLVFVTSFHTQCALSALRWYRDNATPPTGA